MPSAYNYQQSLPEIYLHRVSYPLRDLFLRYLRAHALVTAEQLAHEFSLGIAIVEEQLQQLREQGLADESATRHLGER